MVVFDVREKELGGGILEKKGGGRTSYTHRTLVSLKIQTCLVEGSYRYVYLAIQLGITYCCKTGG